MKRKNKPVREVTSKRTATITGRDFVKLLRSLPHPDKEYLDEVEQFVRNQPPAEKSRWPR
jgi:hypothetical protein